jgi:hypothetical protein
LELHTTIDVALSIPRPSKICPNWDFLYAIIASGNPDPMLNFYQSNSNVVFFLGVYV